MLRFALAAGLAVLAALVGLTLLSTPRLYSLATFLAAGGLLGAAVGAWVLWGAFGYGKGWSYWVVLAVCALVVAAGAMMLLAPRWLGGRAAASRDFPAAWHTGSAFAYRNCRWRFSVAVAVKNSRWR